jgi:hypothetical protein
MAAARPPRHPDQDRLSYLETAVAVHDTQIEGLDEDVRDLSEAIRGLRQAIIGFALTVAASAAILVFGISQV